MGYQTSSDGYYLINDADDLREIDNNLDGKFRLNADIDLSGKNWKPIGKQVQQYDRNKGVEPFTGVFDGNGHSIKGINISNTTSISYEEKNVLIAEGFNASPYTAYWAYVGLFGSIAGATIKNVMIENITINLSYITGESRYGGTTYTSNTGVYAGSLVGCVLDDDCTFENIYVKNSTISVTGDSIYHSYANPKIVYYLGGVVGRVITGLNMRNCSVEGNSFIHSYGVISEKNGSGPNPSYLEQYLGGLIGYASVRNNKEEKVNIYNSIAQIELTCYHKFYKQDSLLTDKEYATMVGGLVGLSQTNLTIDKCISILLQGSNNKNIKDEELSPKQIYFQPILGYNSGGDSQSTYNYVTCDITNCYYNYNLDNNAQAFSYAGTNVVKFDAISVSPSWLCSENCINWLNA